MNDAVLYRKEGLVGEITLNRPDNRNAMNPETLGAFQRVIDQVIADRELRCLIITGSGSNFCSGADFHSQILSNEGSPLPHERSFAIYKPFLDILKVEVPVVGALNGHAIGGGLGLALVCDLRIANRDARYGANFVRLGLHSGMSISYFLPRVVGLPKAAELLLTGRIISGAEAAEIGLANHAVAADEVLPRARDLAAEIAACAPAAVRMVKRSLYRHVDWDPKSAGEWEAHCQSRTIEMEDAKEGIAALLEKRAPRFRGV
ncbi:MAG: putative enoyl-CoA hydratase echA8 [Betaproteobacteria bacterium]|nr:enoyl-CoA hydratase/isomerase family protein [Rhodocyclaceae bacterium]MCG3187484.1 Short-chain-enoyl-CoA hydratase [Rhodocyclaceae bacterium]